MTRQSTWKGVTQPRADVLSTYHLCWAWSRLFLPKKIVHTCVRQQTYFCRAHCCHLCFPFATTWLSQYARHRCAVCPLLSAQSAVILNLVTRPVNHALLNSWSVRGACHTTLGSGGDLSAVLFQSWQWVRLLMRELHSGAGLTSILPCNDSMTRKDGRRTSWTAEEQWQGLLLCAISVKFMALLW